MDMFSGGRLSKNGQGAAGYQKAGPRPEKLSERKIRRH
jgi:hypothetical protein